MGRRLSFLKLMDQLGGNASGADYAFGGNGAGGIKLYGRQEEEELIRAAYERAVNPKSSAPMRRSRSDESLPSLSNNNQAAAAAAANTTGAHFLSDHSTSTSGGARQGPMQELVLIAGNAGTGKTALAHSVRQSVKRQGGFFVSGKFEQPLTAAQKEPYEAFVSAITEFIDLFVGQEKQARLLHGIPANEVSGVQEISTPLLEKCRQRLAETIGDDMRLVVEMVPAVRSLLGSSFFSDGIDEAAREKPNRLASFFGSIRSFNTSSTAFVNNNSNINNNNTSKRDAVEGKSTKGVRSSNATAATSASTKSLGTASYRSAGVNQQQSSNNITSGSQRGRSTKCKPPPSTSGSSDAAFYRIRLVFCKFVRVLAEMAPLVLFLDDLQWADTASIELWRSLLLLHESSGHDQSQRGQNNKNGNQETPRSESFSLLLIGAYRQDEVMGMPMNADSKSRETNPGSSSFSCADESVAIGTDFPPLEEHAAASVFPASNSKSRETYMGLPLRAALNELQRDDNGSSNLRITKINLNNLDVTQVNVLISDLLGKDPTETRPLADVCTARTKGNIFHILLFLRLLTNKSFLTYDDHTNKWSWSDEQIRDTLGSHQTVIEMVKQTMESLPEEVQQVLQVASCLGDEVDESALDLVLDSTTAPLLKQASQERLLVFLPQFGGYRFSHDWIRRAAYEMIPPENREEFHLNIGRRLWKSCNLPALDKNIILVVSLLNKSGNLITDEVERYEVAELNYLAAERAVSVASFPDASRYVRKGVKLLGEDRWESRYDLSLALYSMGAEVEVINGRYDRVLTYVEEVTKYGQSLEDKLRAYAALLRAMAQQDDLQEVLKVGLFVLKQFGEPLPAKFSRLATLKEFFKVRMALRGKTDDDLLKLPPMTDRKKLECADFLNLFVYMSWQARSPYIAIIAFRSVLITLKHGLHQGSAVAFSCYGAMLCGFGVDAKAGYRFGQLSVKMANLMQTRESAPFLHFNNGSFIFHWTKPIKETCLEELLYSSKLGMETGQVAVALMAGTMYLYYSFFTGKNIQVLRQETLEMLRSCRLHRNHHPEILTSALLQMIHCCTGRAENPSRLHGTAIDFNKCLEDAKNTNNKLRETVIYFLSTATAYMFGDYRYAGEMASRLPSMHKPTLTFVAPVILHREALVAVALAREGISIRNNVRLAQKNLKIFTKWAHDSPSTYLHMAKILEAEIAGVMKPQRASEQVNEMYRAAIAAAVKGGYTNEAALACERAGDYKLLCGDESGAHALWSCAVGFYNEWGAKAKSKMLQEKLLSKQ